MERHIKLFEEYINEDKKIDDLTNKIDSLFDFQWYGSDGYYTEIVDQIMETLERIKSKKINQKKGTKTILSAMDDIQDYFMEDEEFEEYFNDLKNTLKKL